MDSFKNSDLTEEKLIELFTTPDNKQNDYLATVANKVYLKLNFNLHQEYWYALSNNPLYNKKYLLYHNYLPEYIRLSAEKLIEIKHSPNLCLGCGYAQRLKYYVTELIQDNLKDFIKEKTCMCNYCPFTPYYSLMENGKKEPSDFHHCFMGSFTAYKHNQILYVLLLYIYSDICLSRRLNSGMSKEEFFDLLDECKATGEVKEVFEEENFDREYLFNIFSQSSIDYNYNTKKLDEIISEVKKNAVKHARLIEFFNPFYNVLTY